ncbi:uncharacterized protein LOC127241349 [Andrographis paniculata]|uniref:uncharacterized protein LOC127241349 n=1 Tax=Andrographis paniculata TaxID=175694 RepID=UPI0021E79690|nr:uncharacterized protein LOC127241349 [Andrographis paniculata]
MSQSSWIFKNGAVLPEKDTPVAAFLEARPGAYTTFRTVTFGKGPCLMLWEKHMCRLSNSFKLLLKENPNLLFGNTGGPTSPIWRFPTGTVAWDSVVPSLVYDCLKKAICYLSKERITEELSITTLVGGHFENPDEMRVILEEGRICEAIDVYMHIGQYAPVREDPARLAVVGRRREYAEAKYSDWVRVRKRLEKLRPPSFTELLLSEDGEHILEGCVSNFFVVSWKEEEYDAGKRNLPDFLSFEVQTAPVKDGVLPGIIRQEIKEACVRLGILFREVAPLWSKRELWAEAFVTNSLKVVQPVEVVRVPYVPWKLVKSNSWDRIPWVEKRFEAGGGEVTSALKIDVYKAAFAEALPISSFEED